MGQLLSGCSGGDTAKATPGISSSRMQLTILLLSLAHYGAFGAPVGAMESSVAQGGLNIPSMGAPRTFDLFYPELPTYKSEKEISTAVPVIHLDESHQVENLERTAADAYLDMFPQDLFDMFPQDLLDSNKKIRPIDLRIIEHDGFIDYEIEFVELSEEQTYDYESDSVIELSDNAKFQVTTKKTDTNIPLSTPSDWTAGSFVDLLRKARRKHRKKVSKEKLRDRSTPFPVKLDMTETNLNLKTTESIHSRVTRPFASRTPSIPALETQSVIRDNNMVKQRKRISHNAEHQSDVNAALIKILKPVPKFTQPGRSTTLKPAVLTESSTRSILHSANEATPIYEIMSSTNMQSYQESPRSGQSNAALISESNKQVNDDSSENMSSTKVTSMPSLDIHQRTEHPLADTTTTVSLISYDPSTEQTTAIITTMSGMSTEGEEDFQLSESRSVINLHSASEQLIHFEKPSISNEENPNSNKDTTTMLITKFEVNKGLKDELTVHLHYAGTSEITTEY